MKDQSKFGGHGDERTFSAYRAILLPAAIGLLALGVASGGQDDERLDDTRATLEKWVEIRRVISKERRDWAVGREILQERIHLVKQEIESFREKIAEAEASIGEADEELDELVAENDRLKEAASALQEIVTRLEAGTADLIRQLPDPVRDQVRPLSQRLPEDPEAVEISLSERFQNIVGILNAVNKFNREVTVTSEVRTLGDGSQAEVAALYVGIGQAYYTNLKGTAAGTGTAGPEGWVWTPANEYAAEIARAIAVLKNEAPADFVRLPIRIQ